ncbi:alpha/beta hydrolase [Mycoplasmatota bacterium]|nr:alpha/beta hydrolase [Mycoplasmatota bacterium]
MPYFEYKESQLFYEVKGNNDGDEVIAFFNGVMASTNSWINQYPIFEKLGYKVLLHDFKGQLKSDKPIGPYTFKDHAKEAKALMDHLKIKKVHIIGTSYGGEVAMRFAIEYPEVTKSISIIDSVSELDSVLEYFVSGWKTLAMERDVEKFYWGMLPTIYDSSFIENNIEILKERVEKLKRVPGEYFVGQGYLYDTFINDVYMTDELSKIKCPALVVCGENDILKPVKFSKIIADNISDSEYVIIPGCGHVTIFEKPDVLNSMLIGFILKNSNSTAL